MKQQEAGTTTKKLTSVFNLCVAGLSLSTAVFTGAGMATIAYASDDAHQSYAAQQVADGHKAMTIGGAAGIALFGAGAIGLSYMRRRN